MVFSSGFAVIEPRDPLPLAGFAGRNAPFRGKSGRLEINGVRFGLGDQEVILLAIDTLFCGDLERSLLAGLSGRPQLLLLASHTHFAPALDLARPGLGVTDANYHALVVERALALIGQLRQSTVELLSIGHATSHDAVDLAVSRRGARFALTRRWPFIRHGVRLAPAPARPIDASLSVASLHGAAGPPPAILWRWACHPVAASDPNVASPAFPGAVREAVRRAAGADVAVLFLPGFCGDIRPNLLRRRFEPWDLARGFPGPYFAEPDGAAVAAFEGRIGRAVTDALGQQAIAQARPVLNLNRRPIELQEIAGSAAEGTLEVVHLNVGGQLQLLCLSAEPLDGYAAQVRHLFGPDVWPVGYLGDVFGYLPDQAAIAEGGYEVDGFAEAFGFAGKFTPQTEAVVVQGLQALADQAGTATNGSN
jgi:hypothetical protein